MQTKQERNLFLRDDTFFGVCEGLGQDLGIHPNVFRLALTLPFFFYPLATIGAYLGLGVLVLATRLAFPNPRIAAAAASLEETAASAAPEAPAEAEAEEVPLAA